VQNVEDVESFRESFRERTSGAGSSSDGGGRDIGVGIDGLRAVRIRNLWIAS
jgi:hypothetical protein